jgi:hypothetical protein
MVTVPARPDGRHAKPRTLERLFQQEWGFSPKDLCDVLRFQHALRFAQESGGPDDAPGRRCDAGGGTPGLRSKHSDDPVGRGQPGLS